MPKGNFNFGGIIQKAPLVPFVFQFQKGEIHTFHIVDKTEMAKHSEAVQVKIDRDGDGASEVNFLTKDSITGLEFTNHERDQ